MLARITALACLLGAVSAVPVASNKTHPSIEAAEARLLAANASYPDLGIVNGRVTLSGEWEGTVMVIGSNGDCEDSGLCTGMFIHVSPNHPRCCVGWRRPESSPRCSARFSPVSVA
jgi:hypothetical protein